MPSNEHNRLCEIGAKFLKRPESANGHGCHFTLIEPACYGENPDVFGVRHGSNGHDVGTILLEVKVGRGDFLKDRKKPHRLNPETGIGKWRYYICPTNLIKPSEVPEKWGLIYVNGRGHCDIVAGAMAVPKEKSICSWNPKEKPRYFRNHNLVKESFAAHAFHERNIQNEMNLLTMALARLDDPEAILYMQREFNSKLMKLQTLQFEHERLQRDHSSTLRRMEHFKEQNMSAVRHSLMNEANYTPYCGSEWRHRISAPRTQYQDGQFHCTCGWVSEFEPEFIAEYKKKWGKE